MPTKLVEYKFNNSIETNLLPYFTGLDASGYTVSDSVNGTTVTRIINVNDGVALPTRVSFNAKSSLLELNYLNSSNITDMSDMFFDCQNLTYVNTHGWDTTKVTNMSYTFCECPKLTSLDLSSWDTRSLKYMDRFVLSAYSLTYLNVDNFNTDSVVNMDYAFSNTGLKYLNLKSFNTSKITGSDGVFTLHDKTTCVAIDSTKWTLPTSGTGFDVTFTTDNLLAHYTFDKSVADVLPTFTPAIATTKTDIVDGTITTRMIFASRSVALPTRILFLNKTALRTVEYLETSNVNTMYQLFQGCSGLTSVNATGWKTGKVTTMLDAFRSAGDGLSLDLTTWDTSSLTTMNRMFYSASKVTSINMKGWTTPQLKIIESAFDGCTSLTFLDVSDMNVSKVTDFHNLFSNCKLLTELDISKWNVANALNMSRMFGGCAELTELNLNNFKPTAPTTIANMFVGCANVQSLNVTGIKTQAVTSMEGVFNGCGALTSLDVSHFDTGLVTNMNYLFNGCRSLTKISVSNFNTSKVTGMANMFGSCSKVEKLDVGHFDTSLVTTMSSMFTGCSSLTSLDVANWKTDKVTTMASMFTDCSSLTLLDVSKWDTPVNTTLYFTFKGCAELETIDVSNFKTNKVKDMNSVFSGCTKLKSINLLNWSAESVTTMVAMFSGCSSLVEVDLSSFVKAISNIYDMFQNCTSLEYADLSGLKTSTMASARNLFLNCTKLKTLDISNFDLVKTSNISGFLGSCSALTDVAMLYCPPATINKVITYYPSANNTTVWYLEQNPTSFTNRAGTTYKKYESSVVETPDDLELYSIGDVHDELDIKTGTVTRRVGKVVLNGVVDDYIGSYAPHLSKIVQGKHENLYFQGFVGNFGDSKDYMLIDGFANYQGIKPNNDNELVEGLYRYGGSQHAYLCISASRFSNHTLAGIKEFLSENPQTYFVTNKPETTETIDLVKTDEFNNSIEEEEVFTNGYITTSSNEAVPILECSIPTSNYFTKTPLLEANTDYTLYFEGEADAVHIGGNDVAHPTSPMVVRSGSKAGIGFDGHVANAMLIKNDVREQEINYFSGTKNIDRFKMSTVGENLLPHFDGVKTVVKGDRSHQFEYRDGYYHLSSTTGTVGYVAIDLSTGESFPQMTWNKPTGAIQTDKYIVEGAGDYCISFNAHGGTMAAGISGTFSIYYDDDSYYGNDSNFSGDRYSITANGTIRHSFHNNKNLTVEKGIKRVFFNIWYGGTKITDLKLSFKIERGTRTVTTGHVPVEYKENTLFLPPSLTLRKNGSVHDEYNPLTYTFTKRISDDGTILNAPITSTVKPMTVYGNEPIKYGYSLPNGVTDLYYPKSEKYEQLIGFATFTGEEEWAKVNQFTFTVPFDKAKAEASTEVFGCKDEIESITSDGTTATVVFKPESYVASNNIQINAFKLWMQTNNITFKYEMTDSVIVDRALEDIDFEQAYPTQPSVYSGATVQQRNSHNAIFAPISLRATSSNRFEVPLLESDTEYTLKYKGSANSVVLHGKDNESIENNCLVRTGVEGGTAMFNEPVEEVMLVKNDVRTQTVPYFRGLKSVESPKLVTKESESKSSILSTPEDLVLRQIGDIKDTLDLTTGEYVKRIDEIVLDGSESQWRISGQPTNYIDFRLQLDDSVKALPSDNGGVCDRLPYKSSRDGSWMGVERGVAVITHAITEVVVSIEKSQLSSSDVVGLKAWLQANPITIHYLLATPITTKIDLSITNQNGEVLEDMNYFKDYDGEITSKGTTPLFKYKLESTNTFNARGLKPTTTYTLYSESDSSVVTVGGKPNILLKDCQTVTSGEADTLVAFESSANNVMLIEKDVTEQVVPQFLGTLDVNNPIIKNVSGDKSNIVETNVTLRSVENVCDTYDLKTGILTQRIGEDHTVLTSPKVSLVPVDKPIAYGDGTVEMSSNDLSLLPRFEYACKSSNFYPMELENKTTYTLKFDSSKQGIITMGGVTAQTVGNQIVTTQDATLQGVLFNEDLGITNLMVMKNDVRNVPTPYFTGIESVTNPVINVSDGNSVTNSLALTLVMRSLPNGVKDELNLVTGEYVQRIGERPYQEGDVNRNDLITDGEITIYLLPTPRRRTIQLNWSNGELTAYDGMTTVTTETQILKPHLHFVIATSSLEEIISKLKDENASLLETVANLEEDNLATMIAVTEVFEVMLLFMPVNMAVSNPQGGNYMVEVYVTLILKGKKTLEQVPAVIRPQVEQMLKDLDAL